MGPADAFQLLNAEAFWLWLCFSALAGGCVGGLGGVVAHRLRRRWELLSALPANPDPDRVRDIHRETSLWRLSTCEGCGARLGLLCLPVLGWALARGRCRSCGYAVPVHYPAAEAALALCFLALGWSMGAGWPALAAMLGMGFLVCAAWTDWETFWIPDGLLVPVVLLGLLASPFEPSHEARIWGMFLPAAFAWAGMQAHSLLRGSDSVAGGDVLMLAAAGAMLGCDLAPALLILSCAFFVLYAYPMRVFGLSRADDPLRASAAGDLGSRALAMGPAIAAAAFACSLFPHALASPLGEAIGLR